MLLSQQKLSEADEIEDRGLVNQLKLSKRQNIVQLLNWEDNKG